MEDTDDAILASGFFAAISSFLEEARASKLDNFTSKSELFMFNHVDPQDLVIVGVFNNKINIKIADQILSNIEQELAKTDFFKGNPNRESEDRKLFKQKIESIQTTIFEETLDETYLDQIVRDQGDIMLGLIVDLQTKEKLWHFANPPTLYSKALIEQLLLLNQVFENLLNKLYDEATVKQIVINSSRHTLTGYKNWKKFYMLMGRKSGKLETFIPEMAYMTKVVLEDQDRISTKMKGTEFTSIPENYPVITPILISTMLNNIENIMSRILKRNKFDDISLIFNLEGKLQSIDMTSEKDYILLELPKR